MITAEFSKQIADYEVKIKRSKDLLEARRQMIETCNEGINIATQLLQKDNLDPLRRIDIDIRRLEYMEKRIDYEAYHKITKEVIEEDETEWERLVKEKTKILAEMPVKWDEYVDIIREKHHKIRNNNKEEHLRNTYSELMAKAQKEFETEDQKIDFFKLLREHALRGQKKD